MSFCLYLLVGFLPIHSEARFLSATVGTGWTITDTVTSTNTLTHIPTYLIISYLAPTLLLSLVYAFVPPMHDAKHSQSLWIILALAQTAGIMNTVFGIILAEQLILQSWTTVAWFVGTIAALHGQSTDRSLEPASLSCTNSLYQARTTVDFGARISWRGGASYHPSNHRPQRAIPQPDIQRH